MQVAARLASLCCALLLGPVAWAADTAAAEAAFAKSKNCLACHAIEKKVVGPAFKAVADKYRQDPAALERLALKVRQGGNGAWGVVYMPANAPVSPEESKRLVAWVLGLK
ncbi:MAG: c-type cytochrome [Betaproteobacteria bacterium]